MLTLLLTTAAFAAPPEFTFSEWYDPDQDHTAFFADGTNRYLPTSPVSEWRDVGYVSDVDSSVQVQCEMGSDLSIRMDTSGQVQMRGYLDAEGSCEIVCQECHIPNAVTVLGTITADDI